MFAIKCIVAAVFILSSALSAPTQDTRTLELVHVFFRHGDRTPDKKDFYPSDLYNENDFYPMGLGQLTNQGKLREYHLGTMLRKRFDKFLGNIYTPDILSATSSDYDRTKMSLLLVLAGLWPPASVQHWNKGLSWQPIPFNYNPSASDHIIKRPDSYCPRYLKELESVLNSNEVHKYMEDNNEIFKYIENSTKKPIKRPIDLFNIYQNLNAEASLNLTLPEWTKKVYPEPLHTFASMQCKYENFNDVLKKLNGGRGLQKVLEHSKAKMDGSLTKGRKLYLYSGHENNVINVLAALDLYKPHVPIYGSAVIFELFKDLKTKQYEMRVSHFNQHHHDPQILSLKGCYEFCPFQKFVDLTAHKVPVNYTAECESEVNLD